MAIVDISLVFLFNQEIYSPIKNDYKVRVSKEGKVELDLIKEENPKSNLPIIWKNM